MASALYDKGREGILDNTIDINAGVVRSILVTSSYTVNLATHEDFADLTNTIGASGGTGRADGVVLASKTFTAGVLDGVDSVLIAVTGAACNAIVQYIDTGVDGTSRLIAYIDTATGLPVTPNGGDITFQWDSGTDKIFKL